MNQRFKAIILFLIDPRSLILAFALFNFILIWTEAWDLAYGGIACVACPWYDPWSWLNEPTLLLFSAFCLRLNRMWGYAIAIILSGYLVGYFILLIFRFGMAPLRADWLVIRMDYPYIVGSWDSQYFFALIILCCSMFYLARAILRANSLRRTASATQA